MWYLLLFALVDVAFTQELSGYTLIADSKYCNPWKYLPEGAYPPRLSQSHPLYHSDPIMECAKRCLADTTSGSPGFFLRYNRDCACTSTTNNDCSRSSGAGGYTTYTMTFSSAPTQPSCPSGYSGSPCTICAKGKYSSDGTACVDCGDGEYQDQAGQPECKVCSGTEDPTSDRHGCQCKDGHGGSPCAICAAGKFSSDGAACAPCGGNEEPNADKTDCQCEAGYEMNGATCIASVCINSANILTGDCPYTEDVIAPMEIVMYGWKTTNYCNTKYMNTPWDGYALEFNGETITQPAYNVFDVTEDFPSVPSGTIKQVISDPTGYISSSQKRCTKWYLQCKEDTNVVLAVGCHGVYCEYYPTSVIPHDVTAGPWDFTNNCKGGGPQQKTCGAGGRFNNNVCTQPCDAGYYMASECTVCPNGFYQDQMGQTSCKGCDEGQYQDQTAQSSCSGCPKGKFGDQTGQTSVSSCQWCDGYQDQTGQATCKTCPGGFAPLNNREACGCAPGYYGASCEACLQGQFQDGVGQSSCKNCLRGHYQGQTGQASCKECEIGSYEDEEGKTSCKDCPAANTKGMTKCSCETGQYVAMGTVTGIAESNTLYCPDGESYSSVQKNFYSGQDWNIGSTNRLNAAAGLGSYNSNVYVNDGAYLSTWGATPDADTSVSYFKTCYAQCKGEAGVKRIAVGDYGRDNDFWTVHCYCLTTDGSGCTVDTALVQLTSAHWYVAGTKDIKVFDLIAEETCEDCPAGFYQDQQGISTTCKSCPSGLYQDQTGQISCESCSVVYVPNAEKTGCSYCAAEDTNFNDDWTTGCGPWASVDGCSCVCGDSGFTGDHCHECVEGKGWNATSQTCDACEHPFINNQVTHDAGCSHAYCPLGQGTTKDINTWTADNSSSNCVPCEGITVSPGYYGQCAYINCDGQTVPKILIDHTLSTTNQTNCEECPSDKVKNGIQCVTPVCTSGYPKVKPDQSFAHDDSRNCFSIPNTCSAGTGLVMDDLPQFSAFAVKGDLVAGVEGITLVVVNEEGHRVSVQPHAHKNILDLAWVGDKIAVVMDVDWVRLYTVTIYPLTIQESEIIYDSFTHIDVDSFDYIYLGKTSWDPGKKYNAETLSAINLPVFGGHVSAGGGSVAGCAFGSIQFHRDGTTKSFSVPGCSLVDVNQFGTHVAFKTTTGDVYIWNIENAEPVSIDIESSALVWVYDTLYFGNSGGVYSISAPYNQVPTEAYIPDVSVTHLDVVGENTMELVITGESVRVKLSCLSCEGLTSNDGPGLFCKDIWCSSDKTPKETINHALAFNDNDNCKPCSGLNSGVPCLPIECPDGYRVNPVDHTYDYDDIRNCAPCLSTQVSDGTECQDIICPLGQKINRVGTGYSPQDDRNCEVCPDFHVGDGKVCTAGFCNLKAFSDSFDQTIAYADTSNCGATCSGNTIKDGSQCSPCVGETIPDATRDNCIPITCPGGYELDFTSNSVVYENGELLSPLQNCADIDDCVGVSCAECVDLLNGYYCTSDIRMGDTLETFSRENVELCPEGFRLTWNPTESGKDLGAFVCPPFVSYREKIEYDGTNVNSIMFDGTCSNTTFTTESTCLADVVRECSNQQFTNENTCLGEKGVWTATCSINSITDRSSCLSQSVNTWRHVSSAYGLHFYSCYDPQDNALSISPMEVCLAEKAVWTAKCSISGIDNEEACITPTNTWGDNSINTWTKFVNTANYHNTKCEYNYKYISQNDEPFYTANGGREAVTREGTIYLYCPIKCSQDEPCGVDQACVAGTCVEHTCTDNAQASECTCYGTTCNKWCMDNGECVDIVDTSVSNDIDAVVSAYNDIQ